MNPKTKLLILAFFATIAFSLKGQNVKLGMNSMFDYGNLKEHYTSDSAFTAFKANSDYPSRKDTEIADKFMESDLYFAQSEKSIFQLNPILHYQYFLGGNESFQGFGLGMSSRYSFKDKLSAGLDFAYFAMDYPTYQDEIVASGKSVPAMGLVDADGNSKYLNAFINYSPSKIFDFQLGYGRNFIGDGYRSLFLSDFSGAYPYFRINTEVWKLKYTNLFTVQQNSFPLDQSGFDVLNKTAQRTKYTSTHFLDFKATDWLTIGLFETVVWQSQDTIFNRGYDVNYLNPVIFYRPLEFSTGSADNVLMGLNLKARIAKKNIVYSQFIIDEFLVSEIRADIKQLMTPEDDIQSHWWANKYALQFGWMAFDPLGLEGLKTRLEYNFVRPYMYAHSSPDQSYSHKNLPLAHPLGANFQEYLARFEYQHKKWRLHLNYHYSIGGKSIDTLNYGNNVLASNHTRVKEYEVETGQGLLYKTHYLNTGISYLIQEEWKLYAQLGYLHRSQEMFAVESENYIYLKLSTALFSQYFDY